MAHAHDLSLLGRAEAGHGRTVPSKENRAHAFFCREAESVVCSRPKTLES